MEVHVSNLKKLTRVLRPIKNKISKLKILKTFKKKIFRKKKKNIGVG
jgi:hypothetical protein